MKHRGPWISKRHTFMAPKKVNFVGAYITSQ
jgi:hypothetical protein